MLRKSHCRQKAAVNRNFTAPSFSFSLDSLSVEWVNGTSTDIPFTRSALFGDVIAAFLPKQLWIEDSAVILLGLLQT